MTFCDTITPVPSFCADFDDPADTNPNAGWDVTPTLDAGASVTLSSTTSTSAPRSLRATSTQGKPANVTKMFPMTSQISVELDVRFTMLPTSGNVAPIRVTPPSYPGMDVYYFASSGGSYFQEFGDDYSSGLPAPALNVWHHLVITISTSGATSTITASMDGALGWNNHTLLHPWPTPTTAILHVGLASLYMLNNGDVFVDNVVVRVQ